MAVDMGMKQGQDSNYLNSKVGKTDRGATIRNGNQSATKPWAFMMITFEIKLTIIKHYNSWAYFTNHVYQVVYFELHFQLFFFVEHFESFTRQILASPI